MRPFNCLEKSTQVGIIPDNAPAKWREAPFYLADPELVTALQVAILMRQPLLLTGEPGCGKTCAAHWAAWRLGLRHDDVLHVQVRSDASAARLRYEFDAVKYFRESQAATARKEIFNDDRERFIQRGPLWLSFMAAQRRPTVLLLDEIDKAPRDFPNDLLHEFDTLEFEVPDWLDSQGKPRKITGRGGPEAGLILIVFTSNGERQLPDAFLRRCLHHHVRLDAEWLKQVVEHRIKAGDLKISAGIVELAIQRYLHLQNTPGLRHRPALSEFLVWLRIIAQVGNMDADKLARLQPAELPYLGALLKDPTDRDLIGKQRRGDTSR